MRTGPDNAFHLTYCSNIHPGNGWPEVFGNLQKYAPALKSILSPEAPFGLGLRLSSKESEALLQGEEIDRFQAFLKENGLYVFTLNGFPFGAFHRQRVKAGVFAPDWRTEDRVRYTLRLIEILRSILPEGIEGSISTSPLTYKPWMIANDPETWDSIVRHFVRIASALNRVRMETGKVIHLDIEPEPDGLIENSAETIDFFQKYLLPMGAPRYAAANRCTTGRAERDLLQYIRLCYDAAHMAVEYEEMESALDRLQDAGIQIGKVQASAALRATVPDDPEQLQLLSDRLRPFSESIYLHQVIERTSKGVVQRYADLSDLFPIGPSADPREWRIHFHLPLFLPDAGPLHSTRKETAQLLRLLAKRKFTSHIEIETYTWELLPPGLKRNLVESIAEEYRWVLDQMNDSTHLR
ncbi:MAG: xylose isomerase [Candidatus Manganitrophaceae bacterium]|nr:MAG: xylose isomerase [Candidatus Manganitrophaceae bacterium]